MSRDEILKNRVVSALLAYIRMMASSPEETEDMELLRLAQIDEVSDIIYKLSHIEEDDNG